MLNSKVALAARSRRSVLVVAMIATMLALSISPVQAAPAVPSAAMPSTPPAPSTAPVSVPAGVHLPPVPAPAVPTGAAQIAAANKAMAVDAPDAFAGAKPTGLLGPVLGPVLNPILGPVLGPLGPPLGVVPQPTTELTGRRNATSKTFATTTPGQLVSQAYSGPIQFRGPDGVMHDTDPTLVASGPGRFAAKATAIGVDLASSPTDANLATVSFDASHTVSFGLTGALPGAAASPQTVAGSSAPSIVHAGILPDVNLELKAGSGGLNETIVLTSPSAPETFQFPLHLTGLTAAVDPASGDIVYTDSAGAIVGRTPHGSMADSNVDPRSGDPGHLDRGDLQHRGHRF